MYHNMATFENHKRGINNADPLSYIAYDQIQPAGGNLGLCRPC